MELLKLAMTTRVPVRSAQLALLQNPAKVRHQLNTQVLMSEYQLTQSAWAVLPFIATPMELLKL
ncbi:hypothetical protein ACO1MH_14715, partial [Staphylococcus aureus]